MAARSCGVSSMAGSRQISIRYLIVIPFPLTRTTNPNRRDGQADRTFRARPPARVAPPGQDIPGRALAPALGLPLIAKDTIKQALMSELPVPDVPASRTRSEERRVGKECRARESQCHCRELE